MHARMPALTQPIVAPPTPIVGSASTTAILDRYAQAAPNAPDLPDLANGLVSFSGDDGRLRPDMTVHLPAGNLYSTVLDLGKFLSALLDDHPPAARRA